MNHTRGALCGGKCGDRGRGGFDDVGALLVMSVEELRIHALQSESAIRSLDISLTLRRALMVCGDGSGAA
jgi:hypothetical protein